MNKIIFSLVLLAIWSFMASCQPTSPPTSTTSDQDKEAPPVAQNIQQQSLVVEAAASVSEDDYYCDISFHYNGNPYYNEGLDFENANEYRGSFARRVDNKISEVYWEGNRCYCWVVVYQDKYWQGLNYGFWIDSESGSVQLWNYITYDWDDQAWETWDTVVSSYSIYCYW